MGAGVVCCVYLYVCAKVKRGVERSGAHCSMGVALPSCGFVGVYVGVGVEGEEHTSIGCGCGHVCPSTASGRMCVYGVFMYLRGWRVRLRTLERSFGARAMAMVGRSPALGLLDGLVV
jgi:hypothetical protein